MKSNACDDYIRKVERELPELCSVRDLIKAGIFSSSSTAVDARATGNTPPYFQNGPRSRIKYPRKGVIEWLKDKVNARYTQACCKK